MGLKHGEDQVVVIDPTIGLREQYKVYMHQPSTLKESVVPQEVESPHETTRNAGAAMFYGIKKEGAAAANKGLAASTNIKEFKHKSFMSGLNCVQQTRTFC